LFSDKPTAATENLACDNAKCTENPVAMVYHTETSNQRFSAYAGRLHARLVRVRRFHREELAAHNLQGLCRGRTGVMPLAISSGAGSGGQNAIGTGTIGGMFSATVLAIFFVPLFFVATLRLFRVKPKTLDNND
jgi:AcrB/AcrD/AcrF family